MRFFVCPCFVCLHLSKYALILDFHNLMFHISIFARLEFIFVGLEIIHTLLRLGSLRVADYAESLLVEPFILNRDNGIYYSLLSLFIIFILLSIIVLLLFTSWFTILRKVFLRSPLYSIEIMLSIIHY